MASAGGDVAAHARASTGSSSVAPACELLGRARETAAMRQIMRATLSSTEPRVLLLTGSAGAGKSTLLASVIREVRSGRDLAAARVLVAQSSQIMKNCEPLQTAKQFLRRWRQPGMNARQVAIKLLAALVKKGGVVRALVRKHLLELVVKELCVPAGGRGGVRG